MTSPHSSAPELLPVIRDPGLASRAAPPRSPGRVPDPCGPSAGSRARTPATAACGSAAGSGARTWAGPGRPGPRSPCPTTGRRFPASSASTSDSPHSLRIIWATRCPASPAWSRRDRAAGPPAPALPSWPGRASSAGAGRGRVCHPGEAHPGDRGRSRPDARYRPKAIIQLRDAFAAARLSFATPLLNQAPAFCSRAVLRAPACHPGSPAVG